MRLLLIAAASLLLAALPARAAPATAAASAPEFSCPMPALQSPTKAQLEAWCHPLRVEAAACAAKGGDYFLAGLSPPGSTPHCVMPTPDAGKACTSNDQCRHSACVPDPGTALDPATGHCDRYGHYSAACFPTIDNGRYVTPPSCPLI